MTDFLLELLTTLNWAAVLQIIAIDILLGGDNAVVIALACRNLPKHQRNLGIFWGTVGAIILRVILVFFALFLLSIPMLKIAGGILLLWIGAKLIYDESEHDNVSAAPSVFSAIRTIIVADFVMSVDNVIAIAGAAQKADPDHQMGLVIFGLLLSIPIIVLGSRLVLLILDRFPIVIYLGAALLGWIGGDMLISDISIGHIFNEAWHHWAAKITGALVVIGLGYVLKNRSAKKEASGS